MSLVMERFTHYLRMTRLKKALPYIHGKVLDVGCCTGSLIELLSDRAGYVGVDISPRLVREVKEKYPECSVYCLDVQQEMVPHDGPFDTIVALALIEHLESPREFLERYIPLLGEGSVIVLTTPTPTGERLHGILQVLRVANREIKDLHHSIFSPPELLRLVRSYGCEVVFSERFELGMNQIVVARKTGSSS